MNESDFTQQLDTLMLAIEDAIEEAELDIDYETAAGILTLTCENDSKVILSRQTPLRQLWLAARSGGFHFDYQPNDNEWTLDSDTQPFTKGKPFLSVLNHCLSEQVRQKISLNV